MSMDTSETREFLLKEMTLFMEMARQWIESDIPLSKEMTEHILRLQGQFTYFDIERDEEIALKLKELQDVLEEVQNRMVAERAEIAQKLMQCSDGERASKAYRTVVIPQPDDNKNH